jgi:hypothetical protein
MPPELELLLCAIRSGANESTCHRVRELAQQGLNWEFFCATAEAHGISALAYCCLTGAGVGSAPPDLLARLRQASITAGRRATLLTGELVRLLQEFDAHGLPVVPLKGAVLAETLYDNPALREFGDLDLLIHKHDIPAAAAILRRDGYTLNSPLAWLPEEKVIGLSFELLYTKDLATRVDLHWEVAPSDYPFRFDTGILWRSLGRARIAGTEVANLSPQSQLLFLCVHGARHMWVNLRWLADLARLATVWADMDWEQALSQARQVRCEHAVLLGLRLVHELLSTPLPAAVLASVEADRVIPPLAGQVKRRLARGSKDEPSSLELVGFNARMADHRWDKVRHYAALLKAPTEADLRELRLPVQLFFLYYPFRLWRMSVKYGRNLADRFFRSPRFLP